MLTAEAARIALYSINASQKAKYEPPETERKTVLYPLDTHPFRCRLAVITPSHAEATPDLKEVLLGECEYARLSKLENRYTGEMLTPRLNANFRKVFYEEVLSWFYYSTLFGSCQ